jgi:RNA polymerase sigma-70 factor (ECF subfamily)
MTNAEEQHSASAPGPKTGLSESHSGPRVNPEHWVQEHGDVLFGFVATRVRDRAIAQDLVQETFLAAIKAKDGFGGRSTERAWLFGILRNKLTDYYRLQGREVALDNWDSTLPEEQGAFAATGLNKDAWIQGVAPKAWETPEESLVSKEFREALKQCLSKLPDKIAQVFSLREIDGVSSDEICKDLGVSPNNLWVMLHRARMGLRRCLEVHWFGKKNNEK